MENKPNQRHQLPVSVQLILVLLWVLIGLFMLLVAILGLVCVVVGTISFFVEGQFLGMDLCGETVKTNTQKALFTAFGAALGIAGIGFWCLRRRGYVWMALIVYGLLLVLFFDLQWLTGNSQIISL